MIVYKICTKSIVIKFLFLGKYVIRFTVTSQYTTVLDITRDWAEIKATATEIINDDQADSTYNKSKVSLAGKPRIELNTLYQ